MKKKFGIITLLTIITISLTGCAKYEKDSSYDTDLYGSYAWQIGTEDSNYFSKHTYVLNKDDTYNYISKEIQYNETTEDNNRTGKILSVEEISNDITQITLDQKSTESTRETSNETVYKYKNMLGKMFFEEIPLEKTFDLIIPTPHENWTGSYPNAANVFNKNGFYHSCLDITECNCTEENHIGLYYKYIRKNNIIYFIDPGVEDMNWQILYYIVEDGLFAPELYKVEE